MTDYDFIGIMPDGNSPDGDDSIFDRAQRLSEVLQRDSRRYPVSLTLSDGRSR